MAGVRPLSPRGARPGPASRQAGPASRWKGEGIELDRAILDELGDPLLHLLRNAVDHGLEPPDERQRQGKPAGGTAGARRRRASTAASPSGSRTTGAASTAAPSWPRRSARGSSGPEVEILTDDLLLKVLGRPGFSTAERVSSVSGRGVGIDVVLTQVRAHGGAVEIASTPGAGDDLHPAAAADAGHPAGAHGQGRDRALPAAALLRGRDGGVRRAAPATDVKGREAIVLRDRVIPIVHLRALLGVDGGEVPPRRPGAGAGGRRPPLGRGGGRADGPAGSRRRAVRRPAAERRRCSAAPRSSRTAPRR